MVLVQVRGGGARAGYLQLGQGLCAGDFELGLELLCFGFGWLIGLLLFEVEKGAEDIHRLLSLLFDLALLLWVPPVRHLSPAPDPDIIDSPLTLPGAPSTGQTEQLPIVLVTKHELVLVLDLVLDAGDVLEYAQGIEGNAGFPEFAVALQAMGLGVLGPVGLGLVLQEQGLLVGLVGHVGAVLEVVGLLADVAAPGVDGGLNHEQVLVLQLGGQVHILQEYLAG